MAKIPFDIKYRPQIESGEYRVETQAGCPVRIVCWDMACELPILGLVLLNDEKAEETAVGFTNEGTNLLGEPLYDKLFIVTPEEELTEFEKRIRFTIDEVTAGRYNADNIEDVKGIAKGLLELAREQFIKDGYVIEKKAFHDAVKKVGPEVMKEVSESVDAMNEALRLEYEKGRAEALKDLPMWKKCQVDDPIACVYNCAKREDSLLYYNGHTIRLIDLKKLPGFKED